MLRPYDRRAAWLDAGDLREPAEALVQTAAALHARGWMMGTSGNLSAVAQREPWRLLVSPSGADKGALQAEQFLLVDERGAVIEGPGKPSDETCLHLAIYARRPAGAVLHTHSVWSTILSELNAAAGGVRLAGYEMLKGLAGVRTHAHAEWVPIVDNSQDYTRLSADVDAALARHADAHGVLLRGHGLYTWGRTLDEARRHVEVFEFLFEVTGRLAAPGGLGR